jgi:hypothetical protein
MKERALVLRPAPRLQHCVDLIQGPVRFAVTPKYDALNKSSSDSLLTKPDRESTFRRAERIDRAVHPRSSQSYWVCCGRTSSKRLGCQDA